MANTYFKTYDPTSGTYRDIDDMYISDAWLIDRFVGSVALGWGDNSGGSVGQGTNTGKYSSPTQVGAFTGWSHISSNGQTTFLVKTDGTLWAMGAASYGEFQTTPTSAYSPVQIGALSTWKQTASSYGVTGGNCLAIKNNNTLWAWGYNGSNDVGILGNGSYNVRYSSPVQIGSLTNWSTISVNSGPTALALKTNGTLWAWGYNYDGQLGNGTNSTASYSSPIQIGSLSNWQFATMCGSACFAIKTDGTLWAWGLNSNGQLGNGTTISYSSPIQIGSLTDWKLISYSNSFGSNVHAVKTDGTLWAWGDNIYGQLGNNTTAKYSSPIQIGALSTWKTVSSISSYTTFGIKTDGTLWSWGFTSATGLMGNNTNTNYYSSPVQIGALTNWKSVFTGGCASPLTVYGLAYQDLG